MRLFGGLANWSNSPCLPEGIRHPKMPETQKKRLRCSRFLLFLKKYLAAVVLLVVRMLYFIDHKTPGALSIFGNLRLL